jgi:hypothetical protein
MLGLDCKVDRYLAASYFGKFELILYVDLRGSSIYCLAEYTGIFDFSPPNVLLGLNIY